jgi:hypothetical protein
VPVACLISPGGRDSTAAQPASTYSDREKRIRPLVSREDRPFLIGNRMVSVPLLLALLQPNLKSGERHPCTRPEQHE